MTQTVDLNDEVDVGTLVALASNIDSLTHIEQEMSGSVTGSPWAETLQDYLERAVSYLDAYRQMIETADTARRKRIAQVLRQAQKTSDLSSAKGARSDSHIPRTSSAGRGRRP
jgi:hypothetical protein